MARYAEIDTTRNDSTVKPGDPYRYQGGTNPFASLLARWTNVAPTDSAARTQSLRGQGCSHCEVPKPPRQSPKSPEPDSAFFLHFYAGAPSFEAADYQG